MEDKALADSFAKLIRDIADEHGLNSISVHINASDEKAVCAYAHWGEKQCIQGFGRSVGGAVRAAIRNKQSRELPFEEAA